MAVNRANVSKFFENLDEVCRICLIRSPQMRNIFQTGLVLTLTNLTGIQMTEDDGLPSKICSKCAGMVHDLYKFQQSIKHSDDALREFLKERDSLGNSDIDPLDTRFTNTLSIRDASNNTRPHKQGNCISDLLLKDDGSQTSFTCPVHRSEHAAYCSFSSNQYREYSKNEDVGKKRESKKSLETTSFMECLSENQFEENLIKLHLTSCKNDDRVASQLNPSRNPREIEKELNSSTILLNNPLQTEDSRFCTYSNDVVVAENQNEVSGCNRSDSCDIIDRAFLFEPIKSRVSSDKCSEPLENKLPAAQTTSINANVSKSCGTVLDREFFQPRSRKYSMRKRTMSSPSFSFSKQKQNSRTRNSHFNSSRPYTIQRKSSITTNKFDSRNQQANLYHVENPKYSQESPFVHESADINSEFQSFCPKRYTAVECRNSHTSREDNIPKSTSISQIMEDIRHEESNLNRQKLKQHIENCKNRKHMCDYCLKIFHNSEKLNDHVKQHKRMNLYKCKSSKKRSDSKYEPRFISNKKKSPILPSVDSNNRRQSTIKKKSQWKSKITRTSTKQTLCSSCRKIFTTKNQFLRREGIHPKDLISKHQLSPMSAKYSASWTCQYCSKVFSGNRSKYTHLKKCKHINSEI